MLVSQAVRQEEQEQGVSRNVEGVDWKGGGVGQGLPKQREEVDDQAAPLVVGKVNKRDGIEDHIGGK